MAWSESESLTVSQKAEDRGLCLVAVIEKRRQTDERDRCAEFTRFGAVGGGEEGDLPTFWLAPDL